MHLTKQYNKMETKIVITPDETGDFVGEVTIYQPGKASTTYDFTQLDVTYTREQLLDQFESLLSKIVL